MSTGFGTTTDDFDLDDVFAQQLATQVVLQGVADSQHAPNMSDQQTLHQQGMSVAEAMHRIIESMAQQQQINEAFRASLNTATAGRSSGLQLKLPHFYGKAGENVTTWIFQCESVFTAKGINNDEQRLHYIASCLDEAALHWYQNECQDAITDEKDPFDKRWDTFTARLKKAFQPPHYQQILR
jgi:hypothetical protein